MQLVQWAFLFVTLIICFRSGNDKHGWDFRCVGSLVRLFQHLLVILRLGGRSLKNLHKNLVLKAAFPLVDAILLQILGYQNFFLSRVEILACPEFDLVCLSSRESCRMKKISMLIGSKSVEKKSNWPRMLIPFIDVLFQCDKAGGSLSTLIACYQSRSIHATTYVFAFLLPQATKMLFQSFPNFLVIR